MKKRAFMLAIIALPVLAVGAAIAAGAFDSARQSTARFQNIDTAIEAGYSVRVADLAGIECIADPEGRGAMGIHMLNPTLLDDAVDADHPELLVYEPRPHGKLKLVAVEYLVLKDAWKGHAKPMLFGHEFDEVPAGNRYGLPAFYALHAWIWKSNPSGILFAWNPRVDCG